MEIEQLQRRIGVPGNLRRWHLNTAELQKLAAGSMGSSMSGNPIPMTPELTFEFLRKIT
jgi:alcohol dehydrogenase class IV